MAVKVNRLKVKGRPSATNVKALAGQYWPYIVGIGGVLLVMLITRQRTESEDERESPIVVIQPSQPAPQPAPQPSPQPSPQPAPQPLPQPAPQPSPQPLPQPSPQPSPQPMPVCASITDPNRCVQTSECSWYACVNTPSRCDQRNLPKQVACPNDDRPPEWALPQPPGGHDCSRRTTIESCNAVWWNCAWYVCANRCERRGTPIEQVCPPERPQAPVSNLPINTTPIVFIQQR